jgi:hypothetical protein
MINKDKAETIRAELKINRDGFTVSDLAAVVRGRFSRVSDYLQHLRDQGLAVYVPAFPTGGRWCAPEYAAALQEAYERAQLDSAERARAGKRARRAKMRATDPTLKTAAVVAAKKNLVLAAVQNAGHDGIALRDLCALVSMPEGTIRYYLTQWRDAGLIEKSAPTGVNVKWGAIGIAAAHAAAWERNARKRESRRIRNEIRRAEENQPLADTMAQRWVPAHEAEPLRPAGPASVWGLAA